MKILVTGGEGFIGRYVHSRAAELGIGTLSYDIANEDDVLDWNRLKTVVTNYNPDAIIHLSGMLGTHELWSATSAAIDVNIKGALNVAEVAWDCDCKLVSIEQPHIWYNVYEATKYAARRMLTGMFYDKGLRVEFVTAHNAYGPGQHYGDGHPQKIVPTFATQAWHGVPITVWGDGTQKVNLVYAGDVADLLIQRAISPMCNPEAHWQAGTDRLVTVNEVAHRIIQFTGSPSKLNHMKMRRGEQQFPYPEPDETYKYRLDWEKLRQTVEWYKP